MTIAIGDAVWDDERKRMRQVIDVRYASAEYSEVRVVGKTKWWVIEHVDDTWILMGHA